MTATYIDISRPLQEGIAAWPGSPGFRVFAHQSISDGAESNASGIEMDVHVGTHVDAPAHFIQGGATLDAVGLHPFVGPAYVAEIDASDRIDAAVLAAAEIPKATERLLLRTSNSHDDAYLGGPFREDFAALTAEGARWVVERGLVLVGIDYLSIQRFEDPPDTHQILLGGGVCILEGLDLRAVGPGSYRLVCLPLPLVGVEAAPARALLLAGDRA
ncbi:MAG TPA: cyclase family protein [Gaiellaceae bacterium]|jgi:arylformamidase|nr:cyclase family protein [Gaiellaceae bacterium]